MDLKLYSYGNIVRILLEVQDFFNNSIMVDIDLDKNQILSVFDAQRKFDADFIRSYLNILRESRVGFRLLTESEEDTALRKKAFAILEAHNTECPEIQKIIF